MRSRPKLVLLLVLAVAGAAYAAYRWVGVEPGSPAPILVSGNIELTEVAIAFPFSGRLVDLAVDEGDRVQAGDPIASLDTEELERQEERALAALASARSRLSELEASIELRTEQMAGEISRAGADLERDIATLDELRAGTRRQELEAAEARVEAAEGEFVRAEQDWKRAQVLEEDDDIATAQLDEFRSRYEVATAGLREARQRLALLEEGPRTEDIRQAEAAVERGRAELRLAEAGRLEIRRMEEETDTRRAEIRQAEAEVAIARKRLADALVRSPISGVVLVRAAEPGEIVAGGAPILTVGDLARPWLRAYINETELGRVRIGAEAEVRTDSFPDKTYAGRITFISSEAEFTPKQIQTQEERVRLVYRIKIDVENPEYELKSNMPADALIALDPAR